VLAAAETNWAEVTAWATIALTAVTFLLVIAAVAAAVLAKRDIKTQLTTSKAAIDTQLTTSKAAIDAQVETSAADNDTRLKISKDAIDAQLRTSKDAIDAQLKTAKDLIDAQLKTAAEDLSATRDATEAAQRAAQRQIEASYRPLLIDVTETTSARSDLDPNNRLELTLPGGYQTEADWRRAYVRIDGSQVFVAVPLRNVGNGLAVIDREGIRLRGDGVGAETSFREVHRERVPPGETTRVLTNYPYDPDRGSDKLQVLVPYTDFNGGQKTCADLRLQYLNDEHWRVVSVTPAPPDGIPV
jgi:hypothetical protein